ncbi:MAG: outer membrane beta-barrel protein [Bacteroidales bacterium]|nr:outer membrane beta-barrel protein [Bacteroidales bacterium]
MKRLSLFFLAACWLLPTRVVAQEPEIKLDSLKMTADTLLLEGVSITAERPLFSVDGEKTLYQVSEDPTVQNGVASDALQNAPGVSVDVEGNITLRGASDVEIWINDQPSHLTKESLKAYIQTLPANAIDRIEVITNPSAKWATDADGIINIVMSGKIKRNEFLCFGTNVSSQPYVMPWASYVWKNDRWTVNAFASSYFYHGEAKSENDRNLFIRDENGQFIPTSRTHSIRYDKYFTYSPGGALNVTYTPNEKNTFALWLNCWDSFGPVEGTTERKRTEFMEQAGTYEYVFVDHSHTNYLFLNSGLYYQHKFNEEGHNLSVRANGNWNRNAVPLEDRTTYTLPSPREDAFRMDYLMSSVPLSANIDYNLPYSKNGEISLGLNGSWESGFTRNDVDTLIDNTYVHDPIMSYHYRTKDQKLGGYLMVQHRFGNFTIQPGINLNYYRTSIVYPDTPNYPYIIDFQQYHYFNVTPSLHLSYRTPSMHNFKLSYSRRVNHPTAKQLSPFNIYDTEIYLTGNPYLEPVYTQNLEVSWTKYWNDFGSVGLTGYYKGKKNEITDISESGYHEHYGRVVLFSRPVNVGRSYLAGGEFNMMYRPNGMFNLRFYANVYNSYLETNYGVLDQWEKNELWSYSLQLTAWAKLWNRLEIHASGHYSSPVQRLFNQVGANYSIDCGMRTDFFNHKLSVFVNGYDLFGLMRYNNTYTNPISSGSYSSRSNSTYLCAGFTLRFGNVELENEAQTAGEKGGQ